MIEHAHKLRSAMASTTKPVACKLRHLALYKVLLCATCGYCVLPQALDRHLKSIHHIPKNVRKSHLDLASKLELATWEDVLYPRSDSQPIPGLAVLSGHACSASGCEHLCVTAKRMQAHWTEKHVDLGRVTGDMLSRPVRLQTFFRGSGLRYFEVAAKVNHQLATPDSLPESNRTPPLLRSPAVERKEDTTMDWLLTKDFLNHSWLTVLPCKSTKASWRDQMLQDSVRVDLLRYAMLSVTASRVAFEYPTSRALYSHEAERYRGLVIQTLAICSSTTTEEERTNFFAYFNLQRLMTICYIAGTQSRQLEEPEDTAVLPDWISVQRKGRAIIWQHRGQGRILNAIHGPGRLLYDSVYCMPEISVSQNPHDSRLRALDAALHHCSGKTEDNETCIEALTMLRRAWENAYRQQELTSFRDMALMWTARVPNRFLELLQAYDERAMAIFAHYCVLWNSAEDHCWYMRGQAETMLCTIARHFPCELREWIEWPIEMVLR